MTEPRLTISLFDNVGDTRPKAARRTWETLCAKFGAPVVREEKDGPLFSPARYSGDRRLQSNVIDLSMLVLEVDGAWRCECCGLCGPRSPMFVSNRRRGADGRVDRTPRCPTCFKQKCEKCYHKEPQPHTETILTRVELSFEAVIEAMRRVFPGSAFAIYSTHSHQRITATIYQHDGTVHGHEVAERCNRLVVPLQTPVPVAQFSSLWTSAVNALQEYEVPADPQARDPNRIFYTPVKATEESPYEYHIEAGEFFDWQQRVSRVPVVSGDNRKSDRVDSKLETLNLKPDAGGFTCHEDFHAELCRRITARGKLNTRGHYDAKCLAHNGRGDTSLCYYPDSDAVACNAGCDYWEIVKAEGLPEVHLPSRARLAVASARAANSKPETQNSKLSLKRDRPLTLAQLSIVYEILLAHFFELSAEHASQIQSGWGIDPYSQVELVAWFGPNEENRPARPVKICSMPNQMQIARAVSQLSEWFDLREVPGFYVELATLAPQPPSAASAREAWQSTNFGQWRLNLPTRKGLLLPRTDERGYVYAIQIYQSIRDKNPVLLTSRSLPGGAKAIAVREAVAA